jgi:WD40 repeat protein
MFRKPSSLLAIHTVAIAALWFVALDNEGRSDDAARSKPNVEADDVSLPTGAIARLGTTRFRHATQITALSYSPAGSMFASASIDRTVCVWDTTSGKKISHYEIAGKTQLDLGPLHLEFAPGGKVYAIGMAKGPKIYLVECSSGKLIREFTAEEGKWFTTIVFSPDGKEFAAACGATLRRWEVPDGKELPQLTTGNKEVGRILYTGNGERVITIGETTCQAWAVNSGKEIVQFDKAEGAFTSGALSPDGTLLAVGSDKRVLLYNADNGKLQRKCEGHTAGVVSLFFSAKSDILFSGDSGGTVRSWDLPKCRELGHFSCGRQVSCYAFSPERTTVATAAGDHDHAPRFWNLEDGREEVAFSGLANEVLKLAFLNDGNVGIITHGAGRVSLWNPHTGKHVGEIPEHEVGFHAHTLLPHCSMIAFGIRIQGSGANVIGGYSPQDSNVISGNTTDGIVVTTSNAVSFRNFIIGNLIGVGRGKNGVTVRVPNKGNGIHLVGGAIQTQIGTAVDAAPRNVISGNGANGVFIQSKTAFQNVLVANYIGTDESGELPVGNGKAGVRIENSSGNRIVPAVGNDPLDVDRNVISGNHTNGVEIVNTNPAELFASINTIEGSFIGTDQTGTKKLPNKGDGVLIDNSPNNTIGQLANLQGSGNLISGNRGNGIHIMGPSAASNLVEGNLIGTKIITVPSTIHGQFTGTTFVGTPGFQYIDGSDELGNGGDGVLIENAPDNSIGAYRISDGAFWFMANTISANAENGIEIQGADSVKTEIFGNNIGTNAKTTGVKLGNNGMGILIGENVKGTRIKLNQIVWNRVAGVDIQGPYTSVDDPNTIFGNGDLGIRLANDSIAPPPTVTGANLSGSTLTVTGSLNSSPNTWYLVELFSNSTTNYSVIEGQTFFDSLTIETDASGDSSFSITGPTQPGSSITATATSADGTTSQFSRPFLISPTGLSGSIITGRVWDDLNNSGLQDPGDPDLQGVTVYLLNASNSIIASTTTTAGPGANYSFTGLTSGTYSVEVAPGPRDITTEGVGDDSLDSDIDATTGRCAQFTVGSTPHLVFVDGGLYSPSSNHVPLPAITSLATGSGSSAGGSTVIVVGSGFTTAYAVYFGDTPSTNFTVLSDSSISVVSPGGYPGGT